jgi:hypothetical protein
MRRLRNVPTRAVALAVLLAWIDMTSSGCAGPCRHSFRDSVVHVVGVIDSLSGAPIDSVFITRVTVDSALVDLQTLTWGPGRGFAFDGDTIRCAVPVWLGTRQGLWELQLLARGYATQTVTFEARYRVFHGGCPSYNDDGTNVVLRLARR